MDHDDTETVALGLAQTLAPPSDETADSKRDAFLRGAHVYLHVPEGKELSDYFLCSVVEILQASAPDGVLLHIRSGAPVATVSHVGFDWAPKVKLSVSLRLMDDLGELVKVAGANA